MRPADLRTHAIVGATVVQAPGKRIEDATILVRDGVVAAVGQGLTVPPEARLWPADGLTVYPGLIDPAVLIEIQEPEQPGVGAHWNRRVHPQVEMADLSRPEAKLRETLRERGFTAAAFYPDSGLFRGTGAVMSLSDGDGHVVVYRPRVAMAAAFDYGGSWQNPTYPSSLMGAIALMRQALYDARWHHECVEIWQRDPAGHEPPAPAEALEALAEVIDGRQTLLFEVSDELNALRAARLMDEFGLRGVLLGSGMEFRRLDEVAALGMAIICPLEYPERPEVSALPTADDVSLRTMMTWEQAPTNPRRLLEAGVTVAFTTHRLEKRGDVLGAVERAIRHGLDPDEALAALTVTPARLLGVEEIMGTIEPGKAANLVVVDGDLFVKKPKIRDTWINGRRYEVSSPPRVKLAGKATFVTDAGLEADAEIDTEKSKLSVTVPEGKPLKARDVKFQHDRLTFVLDGRPFDAEGYVLLSGLVIDGHVHGQGALPDGGTFRFTITPKADSDEEPEEDHEAVAEASGEAEPVEVADAEPADEPMRHRARRGRGWRGEGEGEGERDGDEKEEDFEPPPEELVYPLGAYGLSEPPSPETVAIVGATIWTCGPEGIIEDGALLVRGGRIAYVGPASGLEVPGDARRLDLGGRHVTPGLIDCHSHTGINGGVNEYTHAVTAEVRIADVVNPDDINFYRELAGGLTAANQLHGSANPIGGQNSVVKLRWSRGPDGFRIDDAIGGIKFALGENVKRSSGRYPDTRMGVEAVIRDSFTAAVAYRDAHQRYEGLDDAEKARTMPPRRDLQMDALVEILDGRRIVHCHSYRQDEILMLVRLAEEFGFRIGTFQHVLEGYKVAEAIASHGAGASTFSDWWAYKVEVMDAIPFNGALMHHVGVVVSFNSDSSELARRMNTEAAKAVRYGGVDPHEALKFVTLNPAKQLMIDHRTGSLERGKDADFAVWSESPLSTYTRCEQTWIEGACYFDLERDRELRARVTGERQRLVQKILNAAHGKPKPPDEPEETEDAEAESDEPPATVPDPEAPYSCCWRHEP
jgi:imidazolonepropionase-like amidohydrolase